MSIIQYTTGAQIAALKQMADLVEIATANITYLGFCAPGTIDTSERKWSILKIEESAPGEHGNKITFKWARGQCSYNLAYTDYDTEEYYFKKF